jgi:hypothetical protein
VSVGLTYARSTVSRDTRARATGGSWFSAGGAITMRATSRNTADADMMGGAIGAIAALYMNPKATISGATEALFSAGVAASGALVVDAQGQNRVRAHALTAGIGGLGTIQGVDVEARVTGGAIIGPPSTRPPS